MLKSFFLLAYRNIVKNKFYVLVNILGLGATLACCIVAYLNHRFEVDYNKTHQNLEKIYKVNIFREVNDRQQRYGISPASLAPALGSSVSGVESVVRFTTNQLSIKSGNEADSKIFSKNVAFADESFFDLFTFPVIKGSTSTFSDVNSIVISNETAEQYFGNQNATGESLTLFDENGEPLEYKVIAVLEHIPENSMVNFDAVTIFKNFFTFYQVDEMDWKRWIGATFLSIPNPDDIPRIESMLNGFLEIQHRAREDWPITSFEVMSLKEYTKISRDVWANWLWINLHPAQIYAPLIMSILILLLAGFNYMNSSISIANTRLKEIGVRKAMGSSRRQLIVQFLGENALVCFIALLVSLLIAIFLIDEYNKMWPYMNLEMTFAGNVGFWLFLLGLLFFTSILAGAYSAFYVSSFRSVDIFKGSYRLKEGGWLAKILLWFQVTVSVVAIIASLVFAQNASFQQSVDMGYDMNKILAIPLTSGVDKDALEAVYQSHPDITSIAYTSQHIGWGGYSRTIELSEKKTEVRVMEVGTNYLETMGVRFIEGRGFSSEFETSDIANSVVLDRRTADELGIQDPIGQIIRLDTLTLKVVGVTDYFHMSFWSKPIPIIFWMRNPEPQSLMVIRTTAADQTQLLNQLKSEWEQLVPFIPFSGFEQVNIDEEAQDVNKNITSINMFLAIIAIVLSSIALYTLVSLNILKRIKEIGIRTVLGSSKIGINWLISKPFIIIVILASVVGGLGGYYLSSLLLNSLWPVRIAIGVGSIAIPVLAVVVLAYLIMSIKILTTTLKNPVESLRYE